jgi:hypothetical protein
MAASSSVKFADNPPRPTLHELDAGNAEDREDDLGEVGTCGGQVGANLDFGEGLELRPNIDEGITDEGRLTVVVTFFGEVAGERVEIVRVALGPEGAGRSLGSRANVFDYRKILRHN